MGKKAGPPREVIVAKRFMSTIGALNIKSTAFVTNSDIWGFCTRWRVRTGDLPKTKVIDMRDDGIEVWPVMAFILIVASAFLVWFK